MALPLRLNITLYYRINFIKPKYESNLTEPTDNPQKKIEEMINLMTKNKTGEIIQLIKKFIREEEKGEIRLNILST